MTPEVEIALLRKLLLQTTKAYDTQIAQVAVSEQALRANEQQLNLVLDNINACVYIKDSDGYYTYANQALCELWQVSLSELIGKTDAYFLNESSAQSVRLNDKYVQATGQIFQTEEKIQVRNEPVARTYLSSKIPLQNDNDEVFAVLGVSTDISDRARTENELNLAAMVFQNSGEAILVADADNTIITVNHAFERISGYSSEEVIGQKASIMRSHLHDDEFFSEMWHSLSDDGQWRGELWNRHKNGSQYAVLATITTIFDKQGNPEKRVALYSDITEKKTKDKLIWRQANYCSLTGLPNRNLFSELLSKQIENNPRSDQGFALLFLDLDRFKEVNDSLGHHMGDKLLQIVAERLSASIRTSDSIGRFGGDEFVILLSGISDKKDISRIATNIIESISQPITLGDDEFFTSISIGITLFPENSSTVSDLLKNADQAMYAAKQNGRNCFSFFSDSMQNDFNYRIQLANELRVAYQKEQFYFVYQPIIDLKTGKTVKAEALIRWNHPERGQVPPNDFIPTAEDIGLINELGNWGFETVARQVKLWRELYDTDLQVSINKSPIQFRQEELCGLAWVELLKELDLPGDAVVIEITESTLLNLHTSVSKTLFEYRDNGIQVAIDDFGTGYSSLSYLQQFDIDYLKIDRAFIKNLSPENTDMALVEAIVVMAHKLGLKVIAEGVETKEQADILRKANCDLAQGYYYARPLTTDDFEKFMFR